MRSTGQMAVSRLTMRIRESRIRQFLARVWHGFSQASRDIIPDLHFPNIEAYVQDDWKIRHNFTVNLGLRYAFFASPEDDAQILDNFSSSGL